MSSTKRNALDEQARIELVLELLGGDTTVAQAAERRGLDPAEVECWKKFYVDGLRHAASAGRNSWFKRLGRAARQRPLAATGGALAALAVLLVPMSALSETPAGCADAGSMDLCLFAAGEPAVAEEVNSNFSKILGWLEQKVGMVGSPDIATTGDVTANQVSAAAVTAGAMEAPSVTVGQDGLVVEGPLTVGGDSPLVMKLVEMGENTGPVSTYVSTTDWNCFVGGMAMLNGDIQENGPGNPLFAYTYPSDGIWQVTADFRTHTTHEVHTIGVVCVSTSVSRVESWWFARP
ncbi:MAG: helix-turn-helix domain-containing protein [Polyangiaceae bacterium]|nr:helix-turn-helix domain-containing protein [Polyangiaceae bacterium]